MRYEMKKLPRTIETLHKRTATLRGLLARGANESKLLKAAAAVREARIRVRRAEIGLVPLVDTAERETRLARMQTKMEAAAAESAVEILSEFKQAANQRSQ
jgi:hypothetical protein